MALGVVVAEDDYLVREAVVRLLAARPEVELVGVCDDFEALEAAVGSERPDVVLTDIRMPPQERTRESVSPSACARAIPTSASWSSVSSGASVRTGAAR